MKFFELPMWPWPNTKKKHLAFRSVGSFIACKIIFNKNPLKIPDSWKSLVSVWLIERSIVFP